MSYSYSGVVILLVETENQKLKLKPIIQYSHKNIVQHTTKKHMNLKILFFFSFFALSV